MIPRIKICGITTEADLAAALDGGADAVGFLVGQKHPSSDFIQPRDARNLLLKRYPFVTTVLVTHETEIPAIAALADAVPTDAIQLHSDLGAPELTVLRTLLGRRFVIGKISVEDQSCFARVSDIAPVVDAILLDSINRQTGQVGGTGITHDWSISARLRKASARPIILAGGLRPSNVQAAISAVGPSAVDVNSGVENAEGGKNSALIKEFVRSVRATINEC